MQSRLPRIHPRELQNADRRHLVAAGNALFAVTCALILILGTAVAVAAVPDDVAASAKFYALAHSARVLPLATVLCMMIVRRSDQAFLPLLTIAGFGSAGEIVLGLSLRSYGVVVLATFSAMVHLVSAWWLWWDELDATARHSRGNGTFGR